MKRIYLDHAAGTPVDPDVQAAMLPYFTELFGNPSALYKEGTVAKEAITNARTKIAKLLIAHPDEIIFTGSATESINLALVGTVDAWRGTHPGRTPHIIISAIEHDAVLETVLRLERMGVSVTMLGIDSYGLVDLVSLEKSITEDTVVVAVMYVNNEIGTIQPIRDIAKLIRKWKKLVRGIVRGKPLKTDDHYPLLYTDACQAANYLDITVTALGVDLMTLSGAKIYGPKGIGLLYKGRHVPVEPVIFGGGQEFGVRSGTENVPSIVGFSKALEIAQTLKEDESYRLNTLRDLLIAKLEHAFPEVTINGSKMYRIPNNVHVSFQDTDHEFLAIALDARGISVATKSACSETDAEISHVLLALHGGEKGVQSGLRITLGRATTEKDIEVFMAVLIDIHAKMLHPLHTTHQP